MKQLPLVSDPASSPIGSFEGASTADRPGLARASRLGPAKTIAGVPSALVAAAMARGRPLDPVFGHVRIAHPAHGELLPDERIVRVARELAWTVPHVEVLHATELRFRLQKAGDGAHAMEVARVLASKCGATHVRTVVATSPLAASLATRSHPRSATAEADATLDRHLDHAESLAELGRTPVDTMLLSTGARILLAAARVRTLLDLACATALPALEEIERLRIPAARALGVVALPDPRGIASLALPRGDDRAAQWAWIATPLLRHAASAGRKTRAGSLVLQLRARLAHGAQLTFALSAARGSVRSQTDMLALSAGRALREADLASPIVAVEVHAV
ncbi:MAG: hypothetical protein IT379_02650 [Deltaproteobacteria bacterium]|nr:hypothetical protein [Deltaproteobacteria bacterium]